MNRLIEDTVFPVHKGDISFKRPGQYVQGIMPYKSYMICFDLIGNTDKDIFAQTSFVVSNRYIKEYNQTISLITSAYSNSCKFINEHPNEAAKLLVKHGYIHNFRAAQLSLPLCNIRYEGAFTIERELTRYLNIFYEFDPKSIGGKLPNRDFIYQPQ